MSAVGTGRSAVAVGGGSGLPATIHALLELGFDTSAVVAMADDGGSTGVLRQHAGTIPPGDVRNCIAAMAADPDAPFVAALQYRLPHPGGVARHALGNLMLVALADVTGSFIEAIRLLEGLVDARGRVHPSTLEDIVLCATDREGRGFCGQAELSSGDAAIHRVWTEPADPAANPDALEALLGADLIVLGPGSLYSSVIPNLLVAGVCDAIRSSEALVVLAVNVANQTGETAGMDAFDHVRAVLDHGLEGRVDAVLLHGLEGMWDDVADIEYVETGGDRAALIEGAGPRVFIEGLVDPSDPVRHSRGRYPAALERVFTACRSPLR